ncbi:oligoribonuclease [Marinobacterium jannaschii]|uniref:oligoribonuclease n=1 Tax=Marinobacterium jannaschii TaxID=64970 RepID=UPI000489A1C2|nr:oligoribonuclease [Marinobacterium jannaschii]
MDPKNNLIWIDLEMTGLDPDNDFIIEIATIVTDKDLNVIAEGPVMAIHQPDDVMEGMDEWCTNTHGNSGLTQRVKESSLTEREAEQRTIEFLAQHVAKGASPICGNSVGQDRRFLYRHMPELEAFFHYRTIDVSTLKELASRWKPSAMDGFSKKGAHLALDDIRESVEELKHYRKTFLKLD